MALEYTKKEETLLFKSIFSGKVSVFDLPVNLYKAIQKNIFEGVTNGFGGNLKDFGKDTLEHSILKGYEANTYAFSGAKTFQQVKDMSISLFDKGKRVSFSEFEKRAGAIFDTYNKTWLSVEYNTATNQALSGSRWAQIERDKFDFPLLRYQTVNDARVRAEHVTIDNIVKPVNDPFWSTYYPPNGWNCRCIVTKHEEGELKETDLSKIDDLEKPNKLFRMNSGKDKVIFDPKHPYFKVEDRLKKIKKSNFGLPIPPTVAAPKVKPVAKPKPKPKSNPKVKKPEFKPDNYEEVVGKGVDMPDEFWGLLKKPLTSIRKAKRGEGSYHQANRVVLDMERYKTPELRKMIVAHEVGHAIHNQRNWVSLFNTDPIFDKVFKKWEKKLGKGMRGEKRREAIKGAHDKIAFKNLDKLKDKFKTDFSQHSENSGKVADTIGALTRGSIGWGHSKSYYKMHGGYGAKVEFFAHAMENKYVGNPYFKELFPEMYDDMIKMINDLIKTIE